MRAIVNQQAVIGQKTGVGCYAYELLRHLQQLPGQHLADGFPCGWERHVVKAWSHVRPFFEPKIPEDEDANRVAILSQVRQQSVRHIRRGGRAFMGSRLRRLKIGRAHV